MFEISIKNIFVCFLLFLSGCVHWPTDEEKLKESLDSWVGKNINDAVDRMGAPTNTFKKPNGETLYTWHQQGSTIIVNNGFGTSSATPSTCDITFIASPVDVISHWRISGNACRPL